MRPLLVLNDIHLGVQRLAGTTLHSANQLRSWMFSELQRFLHQHTDKDLLINGDLFDSFTVDAATILKTYEILSQWIVASDGNLVLARGNHDYQPKAEKISSFDLLAGILESRHPLSVTVVTEPTLICPDRRFLVIPHMPNQDMFEEALVRACDDEDQWVFLHANYDNHFATQSDHSLNVDEAAARSLMARGNRLFFGHEHQRRVLFKGGVYIAGNQWPSSVADCLGHGAAQQDGCKYAHVITPDGVEQVKTWDGVNFRQIDWEVLQAGDFPEPDAYQFIRVTGVADAAQGEEVVQLISKLRKTNEAFVITNAVKIGGVEGLDELADTTFEAIKSFNVLEALLEQLNEREQATIKELLE